MADETDLPLYTLDGIGPAEQVEKIKADARDNSFHLPVLHHPELSDDIRNDYDANYVRRYEQIIDTFFEAIKSGNDDVFSLWIEGGLVTTETKNQNGCTPLLAAIEADKLHTVEKLVILGADVNAYGITAGRPKRRYKSSSYRTEIHRTPLQFAAEKGNLKIVKMLKEAYHADDSLIAPDGQHALRLAAMNGHREIVKYLPSRRGGGWRRWKIKHHKSLSRAKHAGIAIVKVFKFFIYAIPKFFLWDMPKHCIIKPAGRGLRWLVEHKRELPAIISDKMKRAGKKTAKVIRKTPKALWDVVKEIPDIVKGLLKGTWHVIKNTPKAVKIVLLWLWSGVKATGKAIGNVLSRLFSFLHTCFAAIVTFFSNIKFENIRAGFNAVIQAVFVDGPRTIWKWLSNFWDTMWDAAGALAGIIGKLVVVLAYLLWTGIIFLPWAVWEIMVAMGHSLANGVREILVWINPKSM